MKNTLTVLLTAAVLAAGTSVRAEDPNTSTGPTEAQGLAEAGKLKAAMKTGDEASRCEAIRSAAKVRHVQVVYVISPILQDTSETLRITAAEALGTMSGVPEASKALAAALDENERASKTIVAMMASLGALNDPAAVPHIKSFALAWMCAVDLRLAPGLYAAADALGEIKSKASVEALMELRNKCAGGPGMPSNVRKDVAAKATKALVKLTGQKAIPQGDLAKWWKGIAARYNDDMTPVKK
jgi:HEAT repeat protein